MEMELKRDSELLFLSGKWGDSETSLWQVRSHNLVHTRALPHAHQLGLCFQTLESESGGVGTSEEPPGPAPRRWGSSAPQTSCSRLLQTLQRASGCMGPSSELLWRGRSSSIANMDTEQQMWRGREARQEQGEYQAIFYKDFCLLIANYRLCEFVYSHMQMISKRHLNYNVSPDFWRFGTF